MQSNFDENDEAFRLEVRSFIKEHLPLELARRVLHDYHPHIDDLKTWTRILSARGWSTPHWPDRYGGPGWTPVQRFIFEEELRRGFAPAGDRIGMELVGPVLYNFASEEQRQQHLPGIREGRVIWAQGFSEPGSGSDLSSLRTRAVRDGDDYIVNGQKTWTTEGHHADMIFMLVRTDPDVKPQRGISALLIDLTSPGVTRRPIWTIDEGLTVNEVFFDDVRVPATNLVGEDGAGWTYAKFLLTNERTTSAEVPHTKRDLDQLRRIAVIERRNGRPLIEDPVFRMRLARIEVDVIALEFAVLRVLTGGEATAGSVASVLKIRGSELRQRVADLMNEAIGDRGLIARPDAESRHVMFDDGLPPPPVPDHGVGVAAKAIFRRATTIYGGANEIQRSLIAKTILEL